jgi:hypothetical protein
MTESHAGNQTEFALTDGRTIRLIALEQSYTYEGLLLGVPTWEMNQDMMDRLIARFVDPGGYGVPLLFEPEQRPIDVSPHAQPRGTPAALPAITCVGRFRSDRLSGGDDVWSVLRLIWFQDDFAFPIDGRALKQMPAVDWEAHATGWEP